MVALDIIQKSNAQIANLPKGLVALFIGATSGIGQSALQQFAQCAPSPRIYTVARPSSAASHEAFLDTLRMSNPSGTYSLITADASLVSEVDRAVEVFKEKETKLDILFMSVGFMAYEGRTLTSEGLEPSMSTRYYSRHRAAQLLLPLLNSPEVKSPRIHSVLAGGKEAAIKEDDLDLRGDGNWTTWGAAIHAATMHTLSLERIAQENPRISIVHSYPGPVSTPGLARAHALGMKTAAAQPLEEGGARALFYTTNDRYAVQHGLVAIPDGLETLEKTPGGIFLANEQGEKFDNETVLADLRGRGVDKKVWDFTEKIISDCLKHSDSAQA